MAIVQPKDVSPGDYVEADWGDAVRSTVVPRVGTVAELIGAFPGVSDPGQLCVVGGSDLYMRVGSTWRKILGMTGATVNVAGYSTSTQLNTLATKVTALENRLKTATKLIHYTKPKRLALTAITPNTIAPGGTQRGGAVNTRYTVASGAPAGATAVLVTMTFKPAGTGTGAIIRKGYVAAWDPDAGTSPPDISLISYDNQDGNENGTFLVGVNSSRQFYYYLRNFAVNGVEFDVQGYVAPV